MAEGILSIADGGRDVGTYDTATDSPLTLVGEGNPGDALVVQGVGGAVRPQAAGGGGPLGDVSRQGVTVDNRIARWHGTDAEVQSSVVSINDDGDISGYGTLTGGDLGTQLVDTDGLLRILAIGQNGAADRQAMLWDDGGSAWIVSDILEPGMVDISADTNLAADAPIVLTDDTLSHAASGVDADTYTSLTVDALGHVTGGTNPGHVLGAGTGTAGTIPLWDPDNNTLGDSALSQSGGNITASGNLLATGKILSLISNSTTPVAIIVENANSANSTADAVMLVRATGAGGGDASIVWEGGFLPTSYSLGLDNSDSDRFVGSVSATLGTTNWIEVGAIGNIIFPVTIAAGSGPTTLTTTVGLLRHQAIDPAIAGAGIDVSTGVLSLVANLVDNGMADALHRHSELSASDGTPDAVVTVDAVGSIVLDAAPGQTVSLGVNSVEELRVSDADVTVLTNDFIVAQGDAEITAGNLGVGMAPVDAIHVSGASGGITVTETDSAFDAVVISSGAAEGIIDVFVSATVKQVHLQGFGNCWVNSSNGNFGVGTDDPTLLLDVNAKAGFTSIGGIAIKLTNKTGLNTVKGTLVVASTTTDDAFGAAGVSALEVIGVVLEAGITDGEEAWVVVGGKGEVLIDPSGCTHGDRLGTGGIPGRASVLNSPSLAEHFREIGHSVQTAAGSALARVDLHFN